MPYSSGGIEAAVRAQTRDERKFRPVVDLTRRVASPAGARARASKRAGVASEKVTHGRMRPHPSDPGSPPDPHGSRFARERRNLISASRELKELMAERAASLYVRLLV